MASYEKLSPRHDWSMALSGASLVFSLLGRALYDFPDRQWLQSLWELGVFEDVPFGGAQADTQAGLALLREWSSESREAVGEWSYRALEEDHLQLLVGVETIAAPPWESVYLSPERLLFQEETLQVRQWYRRFGLEPVDLHKEPDDHIGLELTFVAYLAALASDALDRQDTGALQQPIQALRSFLSEHLIKWAPAWCDLFGTRARTDFYRGLALLTKGTVTELASLLEAEGSSTPYPSTPHKGERG